jgi:hypothetical protein
MRGSTGRGDRGLRCAAQRLWGGNRPMAAAGSGRSRGLGLDEMAGFQIGPGFVETIAVITVSTGIAVFYFSRIATND